MIYSGCSYSSPFDARFKQFPQYSTWSRHIYLHVTLKPYISISSRHIYFSAPDHFMLIYPKSAWSDQYNTIKIWRLLQQALWHQYIKPSSSCICMRWQWKIGSGRNDLDGWGQSNIAAPLVQQHLPHNHPNALSRSGAVAWQSRDCWEMSITYQRADAARGRGIKETGEWTLVVGLSYLPRLLQWTGHSSILFTAHTLCQYLPPP